MRGGGVETLMAGWRCLRCKAVVPKAVWRVADDAMAPGVPHLSGPFCRLCGGPAVLDAD